MLTKIPFTAIEDPLLYHSLKNREYTVLLVDPKRYQIQLLQWGMQVTGMSETGRVKDNMKW
jgi:hypothetical protein